MTDEQIPLFWRSPDAPAALLGVGGVEFQVTAWAMLDGQFDLLEVIDQQGALQRLAELMKTPRPFTLRTESGGKRTIAHLPDKRAQWEIDAISGESFAVGCYFSAPPGRFALEAEFALPGAERAASLGDALRPLSVVIDAGAQPLLMLAGPQHLPADEDERLLAHTFCGLLRDCHQIPLPQNEGLQLHLWRALTAASEEGATVVPQAPREALGVVDMRGNVVAEEEDDDWRDQPGLQPVRQAVGSGVRCWRISRYVRGAVQRELQELAGTPAWPALIGEVPAAA